MTALDVAIVGGGIAGLSTAVACHHKGIKAHVFEAAYGFKTLGSSLLIWPNAMKCLSEWKLEWVITNAVSVVEQIAWRRPDGRPYFVQSLTSIYSSVGHSGYCVRRSDLQAALMSALPKENVHFGYSMHRITQNPRGAVLHFKNGTEIEANHVIAADGLWSTVRTLIAPNRSPIYSGYGAWLGLSSVSDPIFTDGEGCEFLGQNARIGVFETGRNTRYWFVVANKGCSTTHARVADLKEIQPLLRSWPEEFRTLILDTTNPVPTYVSFYDMLISQDWGSDSITLVGDAMHPFVPNLGQGGCQAIEDGHVIAEGLSQGMTGVRLNHWMNKKRGARVRYMRRIANQIGRLAQNPTVLSRSLITMLGLPPFRLKMRGDLTKQFTRIECI